MQSPSKQTPLVYRPDGDETPLQASDAHAQHVVDGCREALPAYSYLHVGSRAERSMVSAMKGRAIIP